MNATFLSTGILDVAWFVLFMARQTWAVCGATYAVQCETYRQKINRGQWREMKSSRHALEGEGVQVIAGIGVNAGSGNAIGSFTAK